MTAPCRNLFDPTQTGGCNVGKFDWHRYEMDRIELGERAAIGLDTEDETVIGWRAIRAGHK
jgi:hypothetical protein